jgi:hypothetical protein
MTWLQVIWRSHCGIVEEDPVVDVDMVELVVDIVELDPVVDVDMVELVVDIVELDDLKLVVLS